MRALPICLIALMLGGCSMLNRSPVEPVQSTASTPKTEPFQATNGVGLVIRRNQVKFAAAAFHQTWLARYSELLSIRRADNAYLLELEGAHFAETLSAEPIHTA